MVSISDMRLSKIPVPLLIAALVATTAVVVYLQLSVVPVPVVADPNFTTTLIAGTPYMWRGAGSEFTITSNATIKVTYMPVAHVIYINGPLGNASLGGNAWLVYLEGGRPLLVEKLVKPDGYSDYFVFKLVNVTKVGGLSVLVPQKFDVSDTLSNDEANTVSAYTGAWGVWRVVNIYTNGTHLALDISGQYDTAVRYTIFYTLPPAVDTTSTKITSSGYGVSYIVNATTVSAYLMPYQHIVIVPKANARVIITAK
jgi:hypothetical protein